MSKIVEFINPNKFHAPCWVCGEPAVKRVTARENGQEPTAAYFCHLHGFSEKSQP